MQLIIDRFEGDFAVCEDANKNIINIKKKNLPKEAKEGSIVLIKEDKYFIDYDKTKNRQKYIENLTNNLWE